MHHPAMPSARCASRQTCRRREVLALMGLGLASPWQLAHADAPPAEVLAEWPAARRQGAATMRFLGMAVYDILLWSPAPVQGDGSSHALALELRYAMALKGQLIAERSLQEMRRIGPIDEAQGQQWLAAMGRLFPDVAKQDRLTGIHRPDWGARFFHNGRLRGEIADSRFARLFFGIWLSPTTSEPGLRQRLLGGNPQAALDPAVGGAAPAAQSALWASGRAA